MSIKLSNLRYRISTLQMPDSIRDDLLSSIESVERVDLYRRDANTLTNCFVWEDSPQGHTYWANMHIYLESCPRKDELTCLYQLQAVSFKSLSIGAVFSGLATFLCADNLWKKISEDRAVSWTLGDDSPMLFDAQDTVYVIRKVNKHGTS